MDNYYHSSSRRALLDDNGNDEDERVQEIEPEENDVSKESMRNVAGFWLLGLCNNFAYVIMLSAAQDILEHGAKNETVRSCQEEIIDRKCASMSTGSVLLADIIPSLIIKLTAPFFIQMVPFGSRHLLVVLFQAISFLLVAVSGDVVTALSGVVLASLASGLGEISYLALASHFKYDVISSWSSGTGGAGILGALIYAVFTDPRLLAFSPRTALLSMLVVPAVFALTYWFLLRIPTHVHRVSVFDPSTYLTNARLRGCCRSRRPRLSGLSEDESQHRHLLEPSDHLHEHPPFDLSALSFDEKVLIIMPLLRFMIPLMLVYFGEYFINQGMFELTVFDCAHGFDLAENSQYRWYQVLYQLGVFTSRSSSGIVTIPPHVLPYIAILQLINAGLFFWNAYGHFIPHILFIFVAIFYEGLLGGASYVNTFKAVHQLVPANLREFSLGFVSISDTVGILFAGFLAIPAHNFVCSLPW